MAALASLTACTVLAATPPSTPITNTASASYGISGTPITVSGSVTVNTMASTPATIGFLQYVSSVAGIPAGGAASQNVSVAQCNAGAGFKPLPAPRLPGSPALTVPGELLLAPASLYASGDPVFVRVTDYGRNLDPLVAETVVVTVSSNGVDTESLRLTETGPSTGVFIGAIASSSGAARSGNCVLNVGSNYKLLATYMDQSANSVAITADALVDPLGVVFDASTGLPVSGVQITLISMATGQPAAVLGNDGTSFYPSTVTTGASVTDSGGTVYAIGPGRYQFPRIASGSYRLAVTPPANYVFASLAATPALQTLPGAPFFIVTGSRGEVFQVLPGPPIEIDVPLDPGPLAGVQISKNAGKAVVAIGEFVPYTVTVSNGDKNPVAALRIADRLPLGFRYQTGSARLDKAVLADPIISADGRDLEFRLGTLPGNASLSLRYVAAVNAGARAGQAENTAQAIGGASSNIARARVLVSEDLNRSRAILVGRVTQVGTCDSKQDGPSEEKGDAASAPLGLKGVRVLLQDGTYIVTDQEGRWHAYNLRPGTQVVQLDETSLPKGFELQACEQNSRTGGRNFSQFVNLRGGTLWRADFRLKRVASCMNEQLQVQGKVVSLRLAAPVPNQALSATVMLPDGVKVVQGSVMLDANPFAQAELADGFLVARLGAQTGNWQRLLKFELESAPVGNLGLLVQVQPIDQPAQSLLPLQLKAPATQAAQCAPMALPAQLAVGPAPKGPAPVSKASGAVSGLQLVEKLPYDDQWIAAATPGTEWLHPQTGFVPALPVIKVAVKHAPRHQVELKINGALVNPLRYEGNVMNPAGTLVLSNWSAVDLRDGANLMELTVRDPQGQTVLHESRTIHYASGPVSAVLDLKRSQLVADGRTPAVIAVRMLDKDGQPVRRGAGGVFQIAAPYLSQDQADAMQREPLTGNLGGKARYEISADGVALISLQPTTQAGEVVLNFDFGNNRTQEVRTWLTPELREWVLVGFAEGTKGFKTLSGNMDSLKAAGASEQLFDRNRVAFYAKGQIKGEYLMTLAYDSAKEKNAAGSMALNQPFSQALNQAVDPNRFYTLYADATQPQFDAASARKLYLKIEKAQFYALFGDHDTGLSGTELGRYSRTLNGFKSEFKGERFGYNAFASMTAQSFRKDEIQGDGTSGLYRLASRDIVVNSDKVRIEVRDRFRPEIIISSRTFTRYLDYQIDHALGTLFFREPIASRDADFNPVFIVAEYESGGQADAKLTYGGRVAMKVGDNLGQKSEVGFSRIHEGNVGREATLTAADSTVRFGDTTKLRAEIATSQRNSVLGKENGSAYLVELSHIEGNTAARAYARQQDAGFGLGQQAGSEAGTRKMGADARLQLSDSVQLQAETYRQTNLVTTAQREVLEARGQWKNEGFTTSAGLRAASETDGKGKDASVRQLITGIGYELLDKQLLLRASNELDLGSRADGASVSFPNRLILGFDYKLNPQTTLFAQHELARSGELKADTTRVGLRTQPWTGGEVVTSLGNQAGLDGGRMYGNLGLVQKVQISEQWAADFGVDRSQTLRGSAVSPFNAAQPLASGTLGTSGFSGATSNTTPGVTNSLVTGDYTALLVGGAYKTRDWSSNARLEWRGSDMDTKVNLLLGAQRNLDEGRTLAAGLIYNRGKGTVDTTRVDTRLSYAHRPLNSEWIWLDRLQYIHESSQDLAGRLLTRKLINNLNVNWMPNRQTQIALQYGLKYVRDSIDSTAYKGFTDLVGIEARQDLDEHWDIGLHGGMLHSWQAGTRDYQLGVSLGFKLADNAWLSVGYNQRGFLDADFAGAQYRARGLYLNLRVKFDQDSINLNDRNKVQLARQP
ncbi:hypothetical protein [Polaromonas sp. CG_9.11]|uniref:hypothetical protein n=1 Tax=Polaromonas sp. CG_9.11 TaxID=2787730 RepID=UPI00351C7BF6